MATGTRATAPLEMPFCRLTEAGDEPMNFWMPISRQDRRHDQAAGVEEPFQLLALDQLGPPVANGE